jgi:hypothetical protein
VVLCCGWNPASETTGEQKKKGPPFVLTGRVEAVELAPGYWRARYN